MEAGDQARAPPRRRTAIPSYNGAPDRLRYPTVIKDMPAPRLPALDSQSFLEPEALGPGRLPRLPPPLPSSLPRRVRLPLEQAEAAGGERGQAARDRDADASHELPGAGDGALGTLALSLRRARRMAMENTRSERLTLVRRVHRQHDVICIQVLNWMRTGIATPTYAAAGTGKSSSATSRYSLLSTSSGERL